MWLLEEQDPKINESKWSISWSTYHYYETSVIFFFVFDVPEEWSQTLDPAASAWDAGIPGGIPGVYQHVWQIESLSQESSLLSLV